MVFTAQRLNKTKFNVRYRVANFGYGLALIRFGSVGLSLIAALSCGARSSFQELEPCFESGSTRKCQNVCGAGQQQCAAGFWQPCAVPTKSKTCSNNCGSGSTTCTNDVWSECIVQQATRTCNDNCGSGTQICSNNVWQTCTVPEQTIDCANECGGGRQTCANNKWSDCKVGHQEQTCSSVCGTGKRTCDNGVWSACDAPQPMPPKLHAVIRDFRNGQPADFGHPEIVGPSVDDRGLVQPLLGSDDTPVYALTGPSRTVQGAQTFSEWYHDVIGPPAINIATSIDLPLTVASDRPGLFIYENHSFFPIDNQLFGNEGLEHNYSFTLATSANFTYLGNEIFRFSGDDDVFVFINRHLAIDLGGVHGAETATVDLAAHAQEFEITVGNRYPIHIFFAERHPTLSDFVVETSIADIGACP